MKRTRLFTSHQQAFVNLRRGTPGPLPPPNERFARRAGAAGTVGTRPDALGIGRGLARVGCRAALEEFIGRTQADELIIVAQIYDHAARLRSYEITATVREQIAARVSWPFTISSLTAVGGLHAGSTCVFPERAGPVRSFRATTVRGHGSCRTPNFPHLHSRSASHPAIRALTASCYGPGSRSIR